MVSIFHDQELEAVNDPFFHERKVLKIPFSEGITDLNHFINA